MPKGKLWAIEAKHVDADQRVSWRTVRQPDTGKPLLWTTEEAARGYAISYYGFREGQSRVSRFGVKRTLSVLK